LTTDITKEDEGVFTCELTNRMDAKQRKSISISGTVQKKNKKKTPKIEERQ
jgi:hypothetical protein